MAPAGVKHVSEEPLSHGLGAALIATPGGTVGTRTTLDLLKNLVEPGRLELPTFALRTRRSPN